MNEQVPGSAPGPSRDADPVVRLRGVTKVFRSLDATVTAVDDVSLDIPTGSVTALTGPSGCGKSTLLHLIGALVTPDCGSVTVLGSELTTLRPRALAAHRRRVGIVFQRFNLLPSLTVLDNVLAPLIPSGVAAHRDRARELITRVGLAGRENTLATRLSGGQQQRVAIARALVASPGLLLADEPTGNLDSTTSAGIIELLLHLRDDQGVTLIIATHDPTLAARGDRLIEMLDGHVRSGRPDAADQNGVLGSGS